MRLRPKSREIEGENVKMLAFMGYLDGVMGLWVSGYGIYMRVGIDGEWMRDRCEEVSFWGTE